MKTSSWKFRLFAAILVLGTLFMFVPPAAVHAETITPAGSSQTIEQFAASLSKSGSSAAVGVYVKDVLAAPIVQQSGDATYVSSRSNTATQFGMASQYGTIGLLAHNYLAGSSFSRLGSGTVISVILGDGSIRNFQVTEIRSYQALSPNDPYSNFVNLSSGATLSSGEVFNETYGRGGLVLQTCISKNGISSWGRLFVIASAI